jgi:hypothetical protein
MQVLRGEGSKEEMACSCDIHIIRDARVCAKVFSAIANGPSGKF